MVKKRFNFFILVCLLLVLCFAGCQVKTYTDINIYKSKTYLEKSSFPKSYVVDAGKYVEKFFPEYETIDFEYEDIKFYLYDGTQYLFNGVSFALDFYLSENNYIAVKEELILNFGCNEDAQSAQVNNYICKLVENSEVTNYSYYFALLCYNDNSHIVRLFYYYNLDYGKDIQLDQFIESVIDETSCPWDN